MAVRKLLGARRAEAGAEAGSGRAADVPALTESREKSESESSSAATGS